MGSPTPDGIQAVQDDSLFVATGESCVFIRVTGRGSHKTSPALKEFCATMMEKGYRLFIFDLEHCTSMDSTFMGVLAGIARRLPHSTDAVLINLNPKTSEILQTVGLDRLVRCNHVGSLDADLRNKISKITAGSALGAGKADKKTAAETVLAAHEDLVAACPDNLPEFQNVLEFMRKEVERLGAAGRAPGGIRRADGWERNDPA